MARKQPTDDGVPMAVVVYWGSADMYIDFPSADAPNGISFLRGVATPISATLLEAARASGAFEIISEPDPAPAAQDSIPSLTEQPEQAVEPSTTE